MCVTMINPATSWFKIIKLPVTELSVTPSVSKGCRGKNTRNETKEAYFDKSSAQVATLVNRSWFSRYPCCQKIIYNNGREFKLHFEALSWKCWCCDVSAGPPKRHDTWHVADMSACWQLCQPDMSHDIVLSKMPMSATCHVSCVSGRHVGSIFRT